MISYGRQNVSEEDIQAVVDVLRSDFLTQGPSVPQFEQAICDYTGAKYGVATNSGTSALHIACLALGLQSGDWLWTTPITFVASANCGLYCGAQVDFVDIDPLTWNISTDALEEKLIQAKVQGRLPKILVAVHLCGLSCEMEKINRLSTEYGFAVIEDACHAIGGRYRNQMIGSGFYSDITVFSFHPVKTITSGEGGMAMTNNKKLAERMTLYRSHGITRDSEQMERPPEGDWYYQQIALGFNYRMSDIHAALGRSQLSRLDQFVETRHEIADRYDNELSQLPLQLPLRPEQSYSGLHLYVVRLREEQMACSRTAFIEAMRGHGVAINVHYIPVHTQPWYQSRGSSLGDFPEAEKYYREAVTLPVFPTLRQSEQLFVIEKIKELLAPQ